MKRYIKSDIEIPAQPLLGGDYRFTVTFGCDALDLLHFSKSIADCVRDKLDILHSYGVSERYDHIADFILPTNGQKINDVIPVKLCMSSPEAVMECITIIEDTLGVVSFVDPILTYQVDIIIDIEKLGLIQ